MTVLFLFCVATQSAFGYQNSFDGNLHVYCNRYHGEALSRVQSYYSSHHNDRRWHWYCRRIPGVTHLSHCYWTSEVNYWDAPLGYNCNKDYVMTGVSSHHNNHREDRRWRFQCCRANGFYTRSCSLSGYINNWRANINHSVGGDTFFTGAVSYHDNKKE